MKAISVTFLICFALSGAVARAQVGVYGKFDYTRYTDTYANQETSFDGGDLGAYYDFLHIGPVKAGFDLRGSFLSGSKYRYRSGLAGIRVAAHTPVIPLQPYAQFSVGAGGTEYTGPLAAGISSSHYNNKFVYEILAGVDYTVFPHLDFRVIELGYGRMSGTDGTSTNNPANTLFTVGTGLVVRFP
jgi:hypothetical protein